MAAVPAHKKNFVRLIAEVATAPAGTKRGDVERETQKFARALLAMVPDDTEPTNLYAFNSWMGQTMRDLTGVCDEAVRAVQVGNNVPPPIDEE